MRNTILLVLVALLLMSCGLMSPQQQETALAAIDRMLTMGTITQEQYAALRQAILDAGTAAWWEQAVQVIGGAALAYVGVRLDRGAPERVRAKAKTA